MHANYRCGPYSASECNSKDVKSSFDQLVISTLTFQTRFAQRKNVSTTTKLSMNYNPHNNSHFLLLQDYFPAVVN